MFLTIIAAILHIVLIGYMCFMLMDAALKNQDSQFSVIATVYVMLLCATTIIVIVAIDLPVTYLPTP